MSNGAYSHQFSKKRKERGKWRFDEKFAGELVKLFDGGSVLDLGAGIGNYVKHFNDAGILALGYDGIPGIFELSDMTVHEHDLTTPLPSVLFSDWVICLETGEHITPEGTDMLLNNIDNCNEVGVVVSWGQPGQRGKGHINCRPKAEIEQWFLDKGYTLDEDAARRLQEITVYGCFKLNLFVARR